MSKPVRFHRDFEKNYKKRILRNKRLRDLYNNRFDLFVSGIRDYPLYDHSLTGKLAGKRGFSITGDVRVVYKEAEKEIVFLDIGSHNQVYR